MRSLFRSREAETIETIRQKLADTETELLAADQRLKNAALQAALSPDPWAAETHHEALRRARERVELLRHALAEAERLEAERKSGVLAKEREQRNRAVQAHSRNMVKAAQKFEVAITNAVSAFRELLEIGPTIEALLPPNMVETYRRAISVYAIREACHDELARQGRDNPNDPSARPPFPGTEGRGGSSWYPGKVRPLAEALQERLQTYHAMLVGKTEVKPAEPAPAPTEPSPIHPSILAHSPFLKPAVEAVADA